LNYVVLNNISSSNGINSKIIRESMSLNHSAVKENK